MIEMMFLLSVPNPLFICFSFHNNGTEMGSKIVYAHFFEYVEPTKRVQLAKPLFIFFWAKMIQIVFFAYCTESVVYMFLIPKQWNRNID